mmetsp:Transcript_28094/g.78787  ORF Transcript_28094/g.78787 Transcript_28094/m.78787 type:complete len:86 (+) Transcript_28094:375-632(+)
MAQLSAAQHRTTNSMATKVKAGSQFVCWAHLRIRGRRGGVLDDAERDEKRNEKDEEDGTAFCSTEYPSNGDDDGVTTTRFGILSS